MTFSKGFNKNPLKTGFEIFSYIAAIGSLMNLSEEFIKWKNSLLRILENYNKLIHLPFEWIGWTINPYLLNYLLFGSICGGAVVRAIGYGEKKGYLNNWGNPKSVRIFYFINYLVFWPLGVGISILQIINEHTPKNRTVN